MIRKFLTTYTLQGDAKPYRLLYFAAGFLFLTLLTSCGPDRVVHPAFYHWKTTFRMEPESATSLSELKVEKLYIHCFDVEWNDTRQAIKVVAPIQLLDPLPADQEIIPTVFIENEIFQKAPEAELTKLAEALLQKCTSNLDGTSFQELQLDCDWTAGTREAYFAFLESVQTLRPDLRLSVTIRPHQVRDREAAGIPPVNRGMLMAYNFQSPLDRNATNSILDLPLLKGYTKTLPNYPLPLDIALPLFSWGIVWDDTQFKGLMDNLRESDLHNHPDFKKIGEHTWEAQKNTYLQSQLIRLGETIKVESVDMADLQKAADHLAQKSNSDTLTVSLFHFAPEVMRNYPQHELESIFQTFK